MTERIEHIIKHILFNSVVEAGKALDHAELLTDLTSGEKNDLAKAFSSAGVRLKCVLLKQLKALNFLLSTKFIISSCFFPSSKY